MCIHSSLGGHVGCLHLSANVSSAAVNIGLSPCLHLSWVYTPESGSAGSHGNSLQLAEETPNGPP